MYKNAFLTAMAFTLLAGCWTFGKYTVEDSLRNTQTRKDSCIPVSGRLNADATLTGRIGHYQLTLVEPANGKGRFVRGTLILRTQPEGFETWGVASTPLYGFTDVDIKAVGAYRAGSLDSEDPQAPGVLVLEGIFSGERSILLRFGSVANQRDLKRYDGAYAVLDVLEISADSFAGNWRSGKFGSRSEGYFCAKTVTSN